MTSSARRRSACNLHYIQDENGAMLLYSYNSTLTLPSFIDESNNLNKENKITICDMQKLQEINVQGGSFPARKNVYTLFKYLHYECPPRNTNRPKTRPKDHLCTWKLNCKW